MFFKVEWKSVLTKNEIRKLLQQFSIQPSVYRVWRKILLIIENICRKIFAVSFAGLLLKFVFLYCMLMVEKKRLRNMSINDRSLFCSYIKLCQN